MADAASSSRPLTDLLRGLFILCLVALALVFLARSLRETVEEEGVFYTPVAFTELNGWHDADLAASLDAFSRSCSRIKWKNPERNLGPKGNAGPVRDWQGICLDLKDSPPANGQLHEFFERHFEPYLVLPLDGDTDGTLDKGLFTGYYEPALIGARKPSSEYAHPIYARPDDLVMVDLGLFREDLRGRRIAGLVKDGTLRPYADRSEIDAGALHKNQQPFLYLNSDVDSFFLHIQGSGRVKLPDGSSIRLAYDGQNGHLYRAIGRDLIEMGAIAREDMSMEAIRTWLADHPEQAKDLMHKNPSYVFFREEPVTDPTIGPKGAANVPLTPGYSLAVDRKYHAMGLPVWLETNLPDGTDFTRLMIAQDTGGAIRGTIRGDVFFGFGDAAAAQASAMQQPGRMIVLLPKAIKTVQKEEE